MGRLFARAGFLAVALYGIAAQADAGFTPLGTIEEPFPVNQVTVIAPPGCPSEQAQAARALMAKLKAAHVPVGTGSEFQFKFTDMDAMKRTTAVMNGRGLPVFVHGKVKLGATFEEVMTEYEGKPYNAAELPIETVTFNEQPKPVIVRQHATIFVNKPTIVTAAAPLQVRTESADKKYGGDW